MQPFFFYSSKSITSASGYGAHVILFAFIHVQIARRTHGINPPVPTDPLARAPTLLCLVRARTVAGVRDHRALERRLLREGTQTAIGTGTGIDGRRLRGEGEVVGVEVETGTEIDGVVVVVGVGTTIGMTRGTDQGAGQGKVEERMEEGEMRMDTNEEMGREGG